MSFSPRFFSLLVIPFLFNASVFAMTGEEKGALKITPLTINFSDYFNDKALRIKVSKERLKKFQENKDERPIEFINSKNQEPNADIYKEVHNTVQFLQPTGFIFLKRIVQSYVPFLQVMAETPIKLTETVIKLKGEKVSTKGALTQINLQIKNQEWTPKEWEVLSTAENIRTVEIICENPDINPLKHFTAEVCAGSFFSNVGISLKKLNDLEEWLKNPPTLLSVENVIIFLSRPTITQEVLNTLLPRVAENRGLILKKSIPLSMRADVSIKESIFK